MRTLETERLIIRALNDADYDDFYAYISDNTLSYMYGFSLDKDEDRCYKIFSSFLSGDKTYALECKANNKVIGHIIVAAPEFPNHNDDNLVNKKGVTLAFAISPKYQRQGYMKEALRCIIDDLFCVQKYDYIHCGYFDYNIPSMKLQEQFGFKLYGYHTIKNGVIHIMDNLLFREDY